MMQFAQKIPKEQIVSQLATQLTWSHIIEVLPVKDPLAVEFYLTMSSSGRWGTNRTSPTRQGGNQGRPIHDGTSFS